MAQTSKNVLAVLLVVTMLVSLIGTMAALTSLTYKEVPVSQENPGQTDGKVSVYLLPSPVDTAGKVSVNVLPVEDGG